MTDFGKLVIINTWSTPKEASNGRFFRKQTTDAFFPSTLRSTTGFAATFFLTIISISFLY